MIRFLLLVLLCAFTAPCLAVEGPLKVEVIPVAGGKVPQVTVKLTNVSAKAVRLFEDWNSWGNDQLSFRVSSAGVDETVLTRSGRRVWRRNFPSTVQLLPGQSYEIAAEEFSEKNWPGAAKFHGKGKSTMRAVYRQPMQHVEDAIADVKRREPGTHYELWIGTAESKPIVLHF